MKLAQILAATGVAALLICAGGSGIAPLSVKSALAQAQTGQMPPADAQAKQTPTPTTKPTAKQTTKSSRASRAQRRAASRAKRANCTAEARAKGISALRRGSYVRSCMRTAV